MPTSPSPDKRMLVGIPVSCSRFNGCNHFVPGLKTSSFQCQRRSHRCALWKLRSVRPRSRGSRRNAPCSGAGSTAFSSLPWSPTRPQRQSPWLCAHHRFLAWRAGRDECSHRSLADPDSSWRQPAPSQHYLVLCSSKAVRRRVSL